MSSVLTLVVISLFLALGLDPVVAGMQNRGVPRGAAIALVFVGLLAVFTAFISSVIPPVVNQAAEIAASAPQYVEQVSQYLQRSEWVNELDQEYGVTDRVLTELESVLASGQTVTTIFGGIFGAGQAVVSGVFSTVTVLVLTLYFLASLNGMKSMTYALVPASRRRRVQLLGDEITRRIGGFVGGQLLLAAINGLLSWIVLTVLGIPYAEALAFAVGVLGVVPLVGATLGAVIVVIAALFTSLTSALILTAYYIAYQQFENYVLAPRVMARTVSAPGGVILVAALAGGSLLGIVGALIAIPLAAGLLLIVEEVVIPQQNRA
ncbi:AI-2E family transporter [Kineosporiaceae bacterium SCSIO 59966]|nr:AI-2E family transporter [Kineosporiaceae bacterium SCSIO 59966]